MLQSLESAIFLLYILSVTPSSPNPVDLSPSTVDLLRSLGALSRGCLTREADLGVLIELSTQANRAGLLEKLSFHAKFLTQSFRIMKRLGPNGEGYEKLLTEFNASLETASTLIRTLLEEAPQEVRMHFASAYLSVTADSLHDFLELAHDLSWYKNWLIDQRNRH